ncbi:MAG: hypothetical protein GDA41_09855 [Rhodospirillales bacterium]|nr:hypothetical protein [Rhodospirillales bacterium]
MGSDRIPIYVVLAFCAGIFTGSLGALVGVAIAYAKRDEVTEVWDNSVLTYLINHLLGRTCGLHRRLDSGSDQDRLHYSGAADGSGTSCAACVLSW